jgi:hypothetical protein
MYGHSIVLVQTIAMPNDRSQRDADVSTADSFDRWLDRQAAEEDIPKERFFQQLISSYWTLNEMEKLLSGSDDEDISLDRLSGDESAGTAEETHERLDELEELLEAEVERRRSLDTVAEVTADRLTELEAVLEDLASEVEATRESLDRKHESVADRTEELAEELEGEREARTAEQQELAAEQDRISSRLDSEFENLDTILTYLVSRTDELEASISDMESKHEDALTRLRSERDTLDMIKREAADANVQSGECESCGTVIDLGMLSRPYCPECENTLTGVEERQKWLFFSEVTVTTDGGSQGHPIENRDPSPEERRSQSATRERHSPGELAESGSDPSTRNSETSSGERRDAGPAAAGSGSIPDRAEGESEVLDSGDADGTGWAGSSFDRAAVDEADGREASESGERPDDDSDDAQAPFGDLSDLTTEE